MGSEGELAPGLNIAFAKPVLVLSQSMINSLL
jgi:hypothetical protein